MSQKSTQQQTTESSPWSVQTPYLTDAFGKAQSIYDQGASNVYSGPQVAGFTPDQLATFQQMVGYGGNTAIPNTSAAAGTTLANSGAGGLSNAINLLQSFKPSGGTQSNIDAATAYANNPAISDQVKAAMRDSINTANESTLPALERAAVANGNINSNRTAIAQGIVQRGLNDEAGDISANLRGQAYNNGLNLAEQNSEAANNAILAALNGSASAGANASNAGTNALNGSVGQAGGLFSIAGTGGQGEQDANQATINNNIATSEYGSNRLDQLLAQYFGIVGGTGYGGTSVTNGTTTQTPSAWSVIGGLLGAGGNAASGGAKLAAMIP